MSRVKWHLLESNPELLNKYIYDLGVTQDLAISDVISLEEDFLATIPTPSLALLFLFPARSKYRRNDCNKQQGKTQSEDEKIDGLYFMKQNIKNACGTVALIHALANNEIHLNLQPDSVLKKFLDSTRDLAPVERGECLKQNEEIRALHEICALGQAASSEENEEDINSEHDSAPGVLETEVLEGERDFNSEREYCVQGGTMAADTDEETDLHFVTFVHVNGKLVELDGERSSPVVHGDTNEQTFLKDAFCVCKKYIKRERSNHNFSVLTFGAK